MAALRQTPLGIEVQRRMIAMGMQQKHLARAAGLNETYVRDVITGKSRNPRQEHLTKLADALGCTLNDLVPQRPTPMRGQKIEGLVNDDGRTLWTTAVAEVDVYGGMGQGGGIVADREQALGEWQMPTEWLRQEVRGDLANIKIITLEGDSMSGTLMPGDKVIVDLNRKTPSPPGIFVVWDGIALVAKRIEFLDNSDPPTVRITSDNSRYAPYERTVSEVNVVGRIMGRWQRLS